MLSVNRGKLLQILSVAATAVTLVACVANQQNESIISPPPPPTEDIKEPVENEFVSFLKNNEAIITTFSNKTPNTIMECIENKMITKFQLPEDFYQIDDYDNDGKYLRLINPMTNQKGIMILIRPTENMSKIELFDNGIKTISAAWRQIPEKCK